MDKRIRLATTNPDLKDKIYVNLDEGDLLNVYWYIRFNIPLDESSVSKKTMGVTDTKGYIMKTDISYDEKRNSIVVAPLDSYMENVYYILTINKDVRSLRGNPLKNDTHVLFKLKDNQISEFELLKSTVKPPKAVPRPRNYDDMMLEMYPGSTIRRAGVKADSLGRHHKDIMEFMDIKVDLLSALPGVILLIVSLQLNIMALTALSVIISIVTAIRITSQLTSRQGRLSVIFNLGAFNYNRGRYERALAYFQKALAVAPGSRIASDAIDYAYDKIKRQRQ